MKLPQGGQSYDELFWNLSLRVRRLDALLIFR
jgi:hypothetical protein